MSNYIGGSLGYSYWTEEERGENIQKVGQVGNPNSLDSAAAVEIRGSTSFNDDFSNPGFDFDYYQGTGSWFRQGYGNSYDETHISSGIGVSVRVDQNDLAGFIIIVYDAQGGIVFSGVDFIFSDGARQAMGEDTFQQLESYDNDFVTAANQVGPRDQVEWDYPVISGFNANTFVVGVAGFSIDTVDGTSSKLDYTLDWSFA